MAATPLTDEEHNALESGLNLAAAMAGGARPLSASQVQGLYDGFLGKDAVAEAVSVLGLAFGELVLPLGPSNGSASSTITGRRPASAWSAPSCSATRSA